jgi:hypothetical protein
MNRLPAALWLICWPIYGALSEYLRWLEGARYTANAQAVGTLLDIVIWVAVAMLLWPTPGEVHKPRDAA